jgi:fructose-bisphosphate aldolase class II
MLTLRATQEQAQKNNVAIGHFNVSDLTLLKAVFGAARELKLAAVVGVSEGEREFTGTRQIAALVRSLRDEYEVPIFLNADHTHSLEKALEAARAGFDLVGFDLSALPIETNTKARHGFRSRYMAAREPTMMTFAKPSLPASVSFTSTPSCG